MDMAKPSTLERLAREAGKGTNLEALAEKTLNLQTADKFLLASMLLNQGMHELAETIGRRAVQEIQLSRLLARK